MKRSTSHRIVPVARQDKSAPAAIGLDVGYGDVKLVTPVERVSYASLIAPIDSRAQVAEDDSDIVTINGTRYLVGDGVLSHGQRLKDHEGIDEWWESEAYRALLARTQAALPRSGHVVVCIPARAFSSDAVTRVRRIVQSVLDAQTVDVIAQGTAAAIGHFLRTGREPQSGETTGIIDVGSRTTEVIGLDGRRPVFPKTTGLLFGLSRVWETVARQAGEELHRTVDPREVALAVRQRRPLRTRGRMFPIESLLTEVQAAANAIAHDLIAEIERVWPPEFPETVLLAGGGAHYLADSLKAWRPDLVVLPEPEWANAMGCFLYGRVRLGLPPRWPSLDEATQEKHAADAAAGSRWETGQA
ncbi:ParM/StbA family protein [Nitrospira sp. Kam-Ns4a]